MANLVVKHGDEFATTSSIIASNTDNEHASVIKLVRTYQSDLEEFGRVGFEIEPFETAGGIQQREISVLNEQQATLLLTYMRNSDVVRKFKKALVKDFYRMRNGSQKIATPKAEPKQQSGLDKLRIAQAMSLAEETAARICQRFPNLGDNGKQVVYAKILNPFVGDNVIALPRVTSNLLPAGKVGEILGVSGNMIGRLANQNGLKTDEYGEFRLDKSAHSDKQVESFHYNDKAVSVLRDLLSGKEAA